MTEDLRIEECSNSKLADLSIIAGLSKLKETNTENFNSPVPVVGFIKKQPLNSL